MTPAAALAETSAAARLRYAALDPLPPARQREIAECMAGLLRAQGIDVQALCAAIPGRRYHHRRGAQPGTEAT